LQAAQVPAPHRAEHRLRRALTDGTAHPPREAQHLFPAEGGPIVSGLQREAAGARDDARVLDAHRAPWGPLGDDEDVVVPERSYLREAGKARADAVVLVSEERDLHRVAHPLWMRGDVLDGAPDLLGRRGE